MPEEKKKKNKISIVAIIAGLLVCLMVGILAVKAATGSDVGVIIGGGNNPPKYYKTGHSMQVKIYCDGTLNQTCTFKLEGARATSSDMTRAVYVSARRSLTTITNTRGTVSNTAKPYVSASSINSSTKLASEINGGDSDNYLYGLINLTVKMPAHYKYVKQTRTVDEGVFSAYTISGTSGHSTSAHDNGLGFRFNLAFTGIIDNAGGVRFTSVPVLSLYYEKTKYTLTYNVNGGPDGVKPKTVTCGTAITLPNPRRKSYAKFAGWYTAASGGTFKGNAGDSYTLCSGNVTLYAHWTDYYYTIHYDPGAGTGTIANQKVDMGGGNITLNSGSAFSRTDYTLSGWNTKSDGSGTQYSASQGGLSPSVFTTTPKATITLYATWMGDGYNIIYDSNGGSGSLPNQTAERNTVVSLTPYTGLTKKGYHFAGWNKEQFTSKIQYLDQAEVKNLAGDENKIILYAIWQKDGTGFIQRPLLDADMFYNTRAIVGGNGTTYDRNYIDSRMAHIDKVDDPGYFTKK